MDTVYLELPSKVYLGVNGRIFGCPHVSEASLFGKEGQLVGVDRWVPISLPQEVGKRRPLRHAPL